jgi:hypothetical protein
LQKRHRVSPRWLAGHERPHIKQIKRIMDTMHI